MKRALLTQIKNEWRENIWLVIELVIVTLVMWVLALLLVNTLKERFEPKGFDAEDVYVVNVKYISKESPEYEHFGEEEARSYYASDLRSVIGRLREKPYVEAAAFSKNGLPYNYNNYGEQLVPVGSNDSIAYYGNARSVSPDMARVLRYTSLDGKTPEEIEAVLAKGEIVISSNRLYENYGRRVADLAGKMIANPYYENPTQFRVGAIIDPVRRTEFEGSYTGTILYGLDESNDNSLLDYFNQIAVRVKPGMGKQLEEDFRNDPTLSRQRNVRLSDLHSLERDRIVTQWSPIIKLRLMVSGILFLMFIIFLGLLGTFWFRVQQRTGEIAIRKVGGATSSDIMRRLLSEVMILESVAMVFCIAIFWAVIHFELLDIGWGMVPGMEWLVVEGAAGGFVLMSLAILLGIWFPARRAMRIEPAIALKDE